MKLVGVHQLRRVWIGVLGETAVTLIAEVDEFYGDLPRYLADARRVTTGETPAGFVSVARDAVTLAPPVPASARVLCVGLNYRAHAAEGKFEVPEHPTIFGRWTACLTVSGTPAPVNANEPGLDWEGEVAVVVGQRLTDVDKDRAVGAVLGYAVFNDLTSRRAQKLTQQWTLGKNGDRSGPMGPIVTADEVGQLTDGLQIQTRVNGTIVQDGNTRDMIFTVPDLLSRISQTLTLNPGDVVATGTPEGVGYVRTPPWYLQPGDIVDIDVERLGMIRTPIVAATERP